MIKVKCSNCRFCVRITDPKNIGVQQSVCKSSAPTTIVLPTAQGQLTVSGMWPPVAPLDWCGEFEPNESEIGSC